MKTKKEAVEKAAREIVEHMSSEDKITFTRKAWIEGISLMLIDKWEKLDIDDIFDEIEELIK